MWYLHSEYTQTAAIVAARHAKQIRTFATSRHTELNEPENKQQNVNSLKTFIQFAFRACRAKPHQRAIYIKYITLRV